MCSSDDQLPSVVVAGLPDTRGFLLRWWLSLQAWPVSLDTIQREALNVERGPRNPRCQIHARLRAVVL